MARNFHRKMLILGGSQTPYVDFNRTQPGVILYYDTQDAIGSTVMIAFNPALALGRNIVLNGSFELDVPTTSPATNWTNQGNQVGTVVADASVDGTNVYEVVASGAGSSANRIRQSIGAVLSRSSSYRVTFNAKSVAGNTSLAAVFPDYPTQFFVLTGTYQEFTFDADDSISSTLLFFYLGGAGTFRLDNVRVQQLDIAASSTYPGAEELNEAGAHGTATAANWVETGSLTNPRAGVLRVTGAGTSGTAIQAILDVGKRYRVQCDALTDGVGGNDWRVRNGSTILQLGTDTSFVAVDLEFVATDSRLRLESNDPGQFAEFRNITLVEANPMNADITGLTLGVASGTLLENLASSDGINDNLSIDSAELNSFINWDNLSFDMWAIADTWAAGIDYLFSFEIDGDNYFVGYRSGTDLIIAHKGGGTEKLVTIASGSPTGLFHFGGSIDVGNDVITGIYNGLPGGTNSSLGTVVGNLSSDKTVIFASADDGSNSWAGDGGHPTLFNITLDNGTWIERFEAGGV